MKVLKVSYNAYFGVSNDTNTKITKEEIKMSRIVFSNNKNIYEAIKNDYSKHFNISASFKEEHCYISTYKKLKKVTNNMEIFNNKDIIASSGTFL